MAQVEIQSTASTAIGKEGNEGGSEHGEGPFHVLMTSATQAARSKPWMFDLHLQQDYISKRRKVYGGLPSPAEFKRAKNTGVTENLWEGVSSVERDLVSCCERPSEDELPSPGQSYDELDLSQNGALDVNKELRFVGLLARECHTLAPRCLALAILERTVALHRRELEEQGVDENDEEGNEKVSDGDDDAELKPGSKRRSNRELRQRKRLKREAKDPGNKNRDVESVEEVAVVEYGRLERFLAAGGLKILNQWLEDGSEDDPVFAKPKPASQTRSQSAPPKIVGTKPSGSRPLILPVLRLLEHIPFDKKLVVESKINKQIKYIGKEVKRILDSIAEGTHHKDDLKNWGSVPGAAGTHVLEEVKEAVDAVKRSWEEKAKIKKGKSPDPFSGILETVKERLEQLEAFEGGSISKPSWFDPNRGNVSNEKAAAVKKKDPTKEKRQSTQELAARERKAERAELQKRLRAAEDEHKERLAKLRDRLRKREHEESQSNVLRTSALGGKKVAWKDGLQTQVNRNRQLLEEVFVFVKGSSATGMDDPPSSTPTEAVSFAKSDDATESVGDEMEDDPTLL